MTEWFNKMPGQHIVQSDDDPTMLLVGADSPPDWVMTPSELGPPRKLRVVDAFTRSCPKCGVTPCLTLVVDNDEFWVIECKAGCGFVWCRPPEKKKKKNGSS